MCISGWTLLAVIAALGTLALMLANACLKEMAGRELERRRADRAEAKLKDQGGE